MIVTVIEVMVEKWLLLFFFSLLTLFRSIKYCYSFHCYSFVFTSLPPSPSLSSPTIKSATVLTVLKGFTAENKPILHYIDFSYF